MAKVVWFFLSKKNCFPISPRGHRLETPTKLLQGLDLQAGEGLEFGALARPMLRGPQARVFYVDHLNREGLRQKYALHANRPVNALVPVDVVWAEGTLRDAVTAALPGYERWFHYAVAAHVIEHVPDIVWWLAELRTVLSSGASLRLAVADRRFTTDIDRRESQLSDALAAFIACVRQPQPREIIDFYQRYRLVDCNQAWQGHAVEPLRQGPSNRALHGLRLAQESLLGAYHEVTCWVFTPASFVRLMVELSEFTMLWFACEHVYETARGEADFVVHLTAADDPATIVESWRQAERALTRTSVQGGWLPQEDASVLREIALGLAEEIRTLTAQLAERQLPRRRWR